MPTRPTVNGTEAETVDETVEETVEETAPD
jgi:hypothetical protein